MNMRPKREETVIVIDRHGQTTTLSGWRAWLATGAGYLVVALVVMVGLAALLGLAMTFAMVLVVMVPLVLVLVLIAYASGVLRVGPPR
jgi:Na+/melibiose symporter-like transporter